MYNHCYKSTREKTEKIVTSNTLASQNSWKYSAGSFALKATSVLLHSSPFCLSLIHPFFSQLISSLLVLLDKVKKKKKKRHLPNRSPDTWHLHTPFAIYSEYKSKNNISTAKSLFATLCQTPFHKWKGGRKKIHTSMSTQRVWTQTLGSTRRYCGSLASDGRTAPTSPKHKDHKDMLDRLGQDALPLGQHAHTHRENASVEKFYTHQ